MKHHLFIPVIVWVEILIKNINPAGKVMRQEALLGLRKVDDQAVGQRPAEPGALCSPGWGWGRHSDFGKGTDYYLMLSSEPSCPRRPQSPTAYLGHGLTPKISRNGLTPTPAGSTGVRRATPPSDLAETTGMTPAPSPPLPVTLREAARVSK